jgi:hypothetical protein
MSTTVPVEFTYAGYQERCLTELEAGDSDIVVLRTGYGGGKSYAGAQWIHEGSMGWREGAPGLDRGESLVLAPDFEKGGPATYRVFFETLPGENTVPNDAAGDPENSPLVAGYNQNKRRVTYTSGHVVRLGSADKWNRYAGSEFHRIWMDEPSHYDNTNLYDLREMLISRQRTQIGPNTCFWTSTGSGYDQFYDITERRVDADDEPLPWGDSMTVVVESSLENPFLPRDAKEKLRRQFEDTDRAKQALYGGFAAAEGLVYEQFTRPTHVRPRDAVTVRDDWRIYGYDYGWKDPRVLLELGTTPAGQYVALDCYYESGTPVEDAIAWLRRHDKPVGPIYCDHDPEHIDKFRQAGYPAEAATKDLDEGITEVQDVLEVDPEVGPGLLVVADCVEVIREFQSYKEEDVGTSRADDHCVDVVRYAIMGDRYDEDDTPSGSGTW